MDLMLLLVIGVYLIPPILLFRAATRTDELGNKIAASVLAIALLLLPVWDIPVTSYRYNKLCEEQGGIFVYQQVGLGDEFYLKAGELTQKQVVASSGDRVLREVKARGDELRMDKIEERFKISRVFDYEVTDLPETAKEVTTVADGDVILGQMVSINGGAGWVVRMLNSVPMYLRARCPSHAWQPDRPSPRDRLLYAIFYKQ